MFGNFGKMFGPIDPKMVRLSMNGTAVRNSKGSYRVYNVEKNTFTNVDSFVFDLGSDMFFLVPTTKVAKGDIILRNDKPVCVIEANKNTIKAINYDTGVIEEFLPERHVFMGRTYFYQKVYSLFGTSGKGMNMKSLMKMQMMSQMFGGNGGSFNLMGMMGDNTRDGGSANNNFMQMFMMSQMFGGKGGLFGEEDNPLEGLFGEMEFGLEDDEEEIVAEEN